MASPATANFLAAWRSDQRRAYTLVKVELTDPSALTLRIGSSEITTPDGQTWEQGLLEGGPIVEPGDFLESDVSLCTCSLTLGQRRHSPMGASATLLGSLASHHWHGATVTIYLWEQSLTAWADALQRFSGTVTAFNVDGLTATVYLRQRTDWNRRLPTTEVTRAVYPRAPEKSIGQSIPIVYGSHRAVPARAPASEWGAFQHGMIAAAGAQRGIRGVIASIGRGNGGEKSLVLFAAHACKTFNDETAGCSPYLEFENKLGDFDPKVADVVNSAAVGTGYYVDDITSAGVDPFSVFLPVIPQDIVLVAANNADNPRKLLDPFNDTNYCRLDYDALQREITLQFAAIAPPGTLREFFVVIGYKTTAAAAKCRMTYQCTAGGGTWTFVASTTPTVVSVSFGTTYDFGQSTVKFDFNGVATGEQLDVYYCGYAIKYRPEVAVLQPDRTEYALSEPITVTFPGGGQIQHHDIVTRLIPGARQLKIDGTHYAALDGIADDGGGTYTGTASALVERPSDVAHHLLRTYLGQSSGQVETGASTFGSLVKARDDMKNWRGLDMKAAMALTDFRAASDVLNDLSASVLAWLYLSPIDDKWRLVPWKAGRMVDYDYVLGFDRRDVLDVAGPNVDFVADRVMNDVECRFGYDDWTRRAIHSTYVAGGADAAAGRSSSGHKYRNLRDELLTVTTGSNDRVNFKVGGGGALTATFAAGDYAGIDFAQEAQAKMVAAYGGAAHLAVAYGFTVVAGFNDKIDFNRAGAKVATLTVGTMTGEERAADVAAALNAADGTSDFGCTFSRSTFKFTITYGGGGVVSLLWSSGANVGTSAGPTLGYAYSDASPGASTVAVEEEQMRLACSSTLQLLLETGTDGINAATPRSAAGLFGLDPTRDVTNASSFILPHSPKSNREYTLRTSVTRYGKSRPRVLDLRYVNDTDTAREVRNRLVELAGSPRPMIRLASERMPDLERGRVLALSSDWDSVKPYPKPGSDGSWAGKKFMVLSIQQHIVSNYHQEVVAIDVS